KTLNRLDGGYLDGNVERGLKSAKRFDHFVSGRRAHVVSDKRFSAEIPDMNTIAFREAMTGVDYEDQLVSHDRNRIQIGVVGQKRKDSEIQITLPKFVRQASRELTRNFYLYFWVSLSEVENQLREKVQASALVSTDSYTSTLKGMKLLQRGDAFI